MSKNTVKFSITAILLSLLQLTSCGLVVINHDRINGSTETASVSSDTIPETTDVPPVIVEHDHSDEIKKNLAQIEDAKYDKSVVKIATPSPEALDPDNSPEYISEAVAERNNAVEQKHSVSIVTSYVEYTVFYEELSAAAKSGMYYSDLIMLPQNQIASFAAGGLLMNLRSLPGLDFSASFLNSASVEAAAGGFNSYAVSGYAGIDPYSLPAVFFNKSLVSGIGYSDLYSIVSSGEWTWEKFFEICAAAGDLQDIFTWGSTYLGDAVYDAAFVSTGTKMTSSGVMTVPSRAFDGDTSAGAVSVLQRLFGDPKAMRVHGEAAVYFGINCGLFQIERLSAMTELRGTSTAWGILPMPKYDASQSYTSLSGTDSHFFACPVTVITSDKSANVLMSLNAASTGVIKDAYIKYIQYNFLRDNDSANMLDYIIDGTTYDFSYTFGGLYGQIADGTYGIVRESASTNSSMDTLLGNTASGFNRIANSVFGISN